MAVAGNVELAVIGDNGTLIVQHVGSRVRRSAVWAGAAVLLVGGAGAGWFLVHKERPNEHPSGSAAKVPVSAVWPARTTACDQSGRVAMPQGGPAIGKVDLGFKTDPRVSAAALGAASWNTGTLTLSISAVEEPVTVSRLRPVIRKVDTPPYAWTLSHSQGCGGQNAPVWPVLDLDRGKLTVQGSSGAWVEVGTAPDGITGTLVEKGHSQLVILGVVSCEASYEWTLEVGYLVGGVERTTTLGPYRSAGRLQDVPAYEIGSQKNGPGRAVVPADPKRAAVDPCAAS